MFATLRYNHLELYIEGFSFEYQSFKHLLSDNNYLCLQDYLELEKFAQEYYIDFVPNQNGFGHMSDWLAQDEYKNLLNVKMVLIYGEVIEHHRPWIQQMRNL